MRLVPRTVVLSLTAGTTCRCGACGYEVTIWKELVGCPMCGGLGWDEVAADAAAAGPARR